MASTPIDKLDKVIKEALEEYAADVNKDVAEITKKVTKAGAAAVKANAKNDFGGTGRYASGWTSTVETGRLSAQGTIYNSKAPGLPHLLEHGHAKRGGGRVEGKVHIGNVEEKIVREYEQEMMKL